MRVVLGVGILFKKFTKLFLQWSTAIVIGFFVVNLLCFVYERPVGWFETPNGPSPAKWNPNSLLVHGTEGYGIIKTDKNGYVNPEGTLGESYVLCMGSSHTQGKELLFDKNYSTLLNEHFSKKEGELAVYNIACDGNFLPSLIKHFPAAVQAFPGASAVTIEISSIDFSPEELEGALNQANYEESVSVESLVQSMGFVEKIKILIKEYFPLVSLIKSKLETSSAGNSDIVSGEYDVERATIALDKALKTIRSQYDGEIIFIYHTQTILMKDGSVTFANEKLWDAFEKICSENNIQILDMRPIFLESYNNEKAVPYGFLNSKPGNGHLNALGHRLIADALIPVVEEVMA